MYNIVHCTRSDRFGNIFRSSLDLRMEKFHFPIPIWSMGIHCDGSIGRCFAEATTSPSLPSQKRLKRWRVTRGVMGKFAPLEMSTPIDLRNFAWKSARSGDICTHLDSIYLWILKPLDAPIFFLRTATPFWSHRCGASFYGTRSGSSRISPSGVKLLGPIAASWIRVVAASAVF